MADEHKTDDQKTTDQKSSDKTTVTISQEKLDSLINEKFKKGAEKANAAILESLGVDSIDSLKEIVKARAEAEESAKSELQKAQERAETLEAEKVEAEKRAKVLEEKNHITSLAAKHGVKDAEYFEFKYSKAKASEDFNEDSFIESFTKSNPTTPPKTDGSNNNSQNPNNVDLSKMTMKELKAYQATL